MATAITEHGYPSDHTANVARARAGTAFFLDALAGLSDAELDAPSPLPDWTRRHVVAHLARNSEGVCRLLNWARTGIENPMYPSAESREAKASRTSAQAPAARLRADVAAASATFLAECDAMPESAWSALIETTRSGPVPAAVVPWFRSREVWNHADDQDAGVGFAVFPVDVSAALFTELTTGLTKRAAADLLLVGSDTGEQLTIGDGTIRIEAPVGELAWPWLTGRTTRPEAELPSWI